MIIQITKSDLHDCLSIIRRGFETVADELGLTDENCPDRGGASLTYGKLLAEFESGVMMFAYYSDGTPVGFLAMKMYDGGYCGINNIVVLPEYRHNGYGRELLEFCKQRAVDLGARKIRFGMIDDNMQLKKWYEDNGFVTVEHKNYDGAPFTVGKMECDLSPRR